MKHHSYINSFFIMDFTSENAAIFLVKSKNMDDDQILNFDYHFDCHVMTFCLWYLTF